MAMITFLELERERESFSIKFRLQHCITFFSFLLFMFGVLEILFMNSFMCFHRRHLLDGVLQRVFSIEPEKNSMNQQRGKKSTFLNVMKFLEQNWKK